MRTKRLFYGISVERGQLVMLAFASGGFQEARGYCQMNGMILVNTSPTVVEPADLLKLPKRV